jgi:hypothetical protein
MELDKIKKLLHNKELVSKLKRPPQRRRKYLLSIHQAKD